MYALHSSIPGRDQETEPSWGCRRIAQLCLVFGLEIDKGDTANFGKALLSRSWRIRALLANNTRSYERQSVERRFVFCCESLVLKSHWSWSSWINSPGGSLVSEYRLEPSMNLRCAHFASSGDTPNERTGKTRTKVADLHSYRWRSHCRGLYHLPVAA